MIGCSIVPRYSSTDTRTHVHAHAPSRHARARARAEPIYARARTRTRPTYASTRTRQARRRHACGCGYTTMRALRDRVARVDRKAKGHVPARVPSIRATTGSTSSYTVAYSRSRRGSSRGGCRSVPTSLVDCTVKLYILTRGALDAPLLSLPSCFNKISSTRLIKNLPHLAGALFTGF